MAFRFNLQFALDMRKDAVDEAVRKRDEILEACEKVRALLQEQLEAYFHERDLFNASAREGHLAQALPGLERALESRKKRMMDALASLRGLEDEVRVAEQEVILAKRDHKVVANLRERRESEWNKAIEEKERKFLDEQTVLRYARRERREGDA